MRAWSTVELMFVSSSGDLLSYYGSEMSLIERVVLS